MSLLDFILAILIVNFFINFGSFILGCSMINNKINVINQFSSNLKNENLVKEYSLKDYSMLPCKFWFIVVIIASILIPGLFIFWLIIRPTIK